MLIVGNHHLLAVSGNKSKKGLLNRGLDLREQVRAFFMTSSLRHP